LNPLSSLYGAGIATRNRLYDRGTFPAHRLEAPVVSIGSISAGGAGKTPFLIMLGELLKQKGIAFNVLSRGYGRQTKGVALVDPKGSPQEFGDEPLLIARKLGVPVIVGENRYAAGEFAEDKLGLQTHLLDDGFQHRRLARDFDIVLITERDLHDTLLPIGRLREPLSSLTRASALAFVHDGTAARIPGPGSQRVWSVLRGIIPLETADTCFAFCGIARPQNFFAELRNAGIRLAGTHEFRDHHAYAASDVELLLKLGKASGATAFITTEKDEVNLDGYLQQMQPVHVVPVRMQFGPTPERVAGMADSAASPVDQLYNLVARQKQGRVRE
jgi:tetraacyldisaccharide 4'-kinase